MDPVNPYVEIFNPRGWEIIKHLDVARAEKLYSRNIENFTKPLLDLLINDQIAISGLSSKGALESATGKILDAMIKEKLSSPRNKGERFLKYVFDTSPNAFTHFKKWLLGSVKFYADSPTKIPVKKFKNESAKKTAKLFLQSVKHCQSKLFEEAVVISSNFKPPRRKSFLGRTFEEARERFGFRGPAAESSADAPLEVPRAKAEKPAEVKVPFFEKVLKLLRRPK